MAPANHGSPTSSPDEAKPESSSEAGTSGGERKTSDAGQSIGASEAAGQQVLPPSYLLDDGLLGLGAVMRVAQVSLTEPEAAGRALIDSLVQPIPEGLRPAVRAALTSLVADIGVVEATHRLLAGQSVAVGSEFALTRNDADSGAAGTGAGKGAHETGGVGNGKGKGKDGGSAAGGVSATTVTLRLRPMDAVVADDGVDAHLSSTRRRSSAASSTKSESQTEDSSLAAQAFNKIVSKGLSELAKGSAFSPTLEVTSGRTVRRQSLKTTTGSRDSVDDSGATQSGGSEQFVVTSLFSAKVQTSSDGDALPMMSEASVRVADILHVQYSRGAVSTARPTEPAAPVTNPGALNDVFYSVDAAAGGTEIRDTLRQMLPEPLQTPGSALYEALGEHFTEANMREAMKPAGVLLPLVEFQLPNGAWGNWQASMTTVPMSWQPGDQGVSALRQTGDTRRVDSDSVIDQDDVNAGLSIHLPSLPVVDVGISASANVGLGHTVTTGKSTATSIGWSVEYPADSRQYRLGVRWIVDIDTSLPGLPGRDIRRSRLPECAECRRRPDADRAGRARRGGRFQPAAVGGPTTDVANSTRPSSPSLILEGPGSGLPKMRLGLLGVHSASGPERVFDTAAAIIRKLEFAAARHGKPAGSVVKPDRLEWSRARTELFKHFNPDILDREVPTMLGSGIRRVLSVGSREYKVSVTSNLGTPQPPSDVDEITISISVGDENSTSRAEEDSANTTVGMGLAASATVDLPIAQRKVELEAGIDLDVEHSDAANRRTEVATGQTARRTLTYTGPGLMHAIPADYTVLVTPLTPLPSASSVDAVGRKLHIVTPKPPEPVRESFEGTLRVVTSPELADTNATPVKESHRQLGEHESVASAEPEPGPQMIVLAPSELEPEAVAAKAAELLPSDSQPVDVPANSRFPTNIDGIETLNKAIEAVVSTPIARWHG